MQVAPIIEDYMVFLSVTDENLLDPDAAVEMMEGLADRLEAFNGKFLRELIDAFTVIALEYGGKAHGVVRDIAYAFYLEEALAADNPVKLAELEVLRDARD